MIFRAVKSDARPSIRIIKAHERDIFFLVFALLKLKIAEAISIHYWAYMSDHFTNILHLKEFSSFMQHQQAHTMHDKIVLIFKK